MVRLNVVSDVAWEREYPGLFADFPTVQFMDYTKDICRILDPDRPANYHLTFSRSEANEADCHRALAAGHNVTVVFRKPPFPATFWGYPVIDGDRNDLRFLDPAPCIVALKAKGGARRDTTGFVLQNEINRREGNSQGGVTPWNAIETKTSSGNGQTYRIRIYPDPMPNPLEDWSEMGTILSLNRRHGNFDPAGVEEAIGSNPDAVPLSYFEHGLCRWSVAGELPAGAAARWIRSPSLASGCPTPRRSHRPRTTAASPAGCSCASGPPGMRRLYAVVQRRGLRLRDRARHHLPMRAERRPNCSIAAGASTGWITAAAKLCPASEALTRILLGL